MKYHLHFTDDAEKHLEALQQPSKFKILKAVAKTLNLMEKNLRHPSLNTHVYHGIHGPNGEKIFEAYAQQKTPGAYRVFWYYGPGKSNITILAITPHPNH